MNNVCVVVANYDFNENAVLLRNLFKVSFPTYLVDASSPNSLPEADFVIPNTYYPGLWNKAAQIAIDGSFSWLLFVASDVVVREGEMLANCILEAASDPDIQLWTPSLTSDSRYFFKECGHNGLTVRRKVMFVEGFFFMCRVEILRRQYPIPSDIKFGWNIDVITSALSFERGSIVVDDRVQVFHPRSKANHAIDETPARQEALRYRRSFPDSLQSLVADNLEKCNQPSLITFDHYGSVNSLDLGCDENPRRFLGISQSWGVDIRNSKGDSRISVADLVVEPIPFRDSTFSHVTAFDFIQHVPRIVYAPFRRFPFVELMNEIHRVLAPGDVSSFHRLYVTLARKYLTIQCMLTM